MPLQKPVTAVFDIGKSNKKLLLFDENYIVIEKHETKLEQAEDDDGDPCEDLEKLENWIKNQIRKAREKYQIKVINFSAYGASFVHIDHNGTPVTPLYNYLKEYPKDLLKQFYNTVGGREEFSNTTASPPMGMLNSGLQLYWLKHMKPAKFKRIETTLHLPNYLSSIFTGKKASELTSIGCHTGLWDFNEMDYHSWVRKENVQSLLPNPQPVTEIIEKKGIKYGPGIHDSSAALTPYLFGLNEPFMLISTGTWSICFNPFNSKPLTYNELEKDCLCYFNVHGEQVKASRFFMGAEYSYQKKRIIEHFSVDEDEFKGDMNVELLNHLIDKRDAASRLQLEKAYNSGPFLQDKPGNWILSQFSSPKEAYYQLVLDLVAIQKVSFKLAEGSKRINKIIITGGFSMNNLFISLLASAFPEKKMYISKLSDASALGAAMVINEQSVIARKEMPTHTEQEKGGIPKTRSDIEKLLGLKRIKPIKEIEMKKYSWV